jgi:protein TonB
MVQSFVASVSLPASEPELPVIEVTDPLVEPTSSDPVARPSPPAPTRAQEPEVVNDQPSILPEVRVTFPALVSRHEAESLIASFYPLALQRAGVGGSVKLWIWVDEEGTPEVVNMRGGSGYRSLNWAAVRAARELRFQPATRNGHPVGTWVEFDVHFVPGSGVGIVGLDPAGSEGIGGV